MEEHGPETDKEKGCEEVPEPGFLGPREEVVCGRRCCKACRVRDRVPKSSYKIRRFFFIITIRRVR